MASELIIEDNYITGMGQHFSNVGNYAIDTMISDYISKMEEIRECAIIEGKIADALDEYITNAQALKEKAGEMGQQLKGLTECYLYEIDQKDEFLF